MSNLPKLPDLGQFFGDQGGPGMINSQAGRMQTDAYKTCPFADQETGEFCTLDGAMCPFVGFNYRRCRKYTNNMAKGMSKAMEPGANNSTGGSAPRVESSKALPIIQEMVKKRGPIVEKNSEDDIAAARRMQARADSGDGWGEIEDRAGEPPEDGEPRYSFDKDDADDSFSDIDADIAASEEKYFDDIAKAEKELEALEKEDARKRKAAAKKSAQGTGKKPKQDKKQKASKGAERKVVTPKTPGSDVKKVHLGNFNVGGVPLSELPPAVQAAGMELAIRAMRGEDRSEADDQIIKAEMVEFLKTDGRHLATYFNHRDENYVGMKQVAQYFAAMAHQVHSLNAKEAIRWGEDMAHISAVAAGEVVRSSDAPSRDAAYQQDSEAGFGGGTIFTDPSVNADLPKGPPTASDPEDIGADKPGGIKFPDGTKFSISEPKSLAQWRLDKGMANLPQSTLPAAKIPNKPTGSTVRGRPRLGPRVFGANVEPDVAPATPAGEQEVVPKQPRTPYTGDSVSYAKETSTSMNVEQFERFIETEVSMLSAKEKAYLFAGLAKGRNVSEVEESLRRLAREAAETKNFAGIARMRTAISERMKHLRDIEDNRKRLDLQWKQGMDTLKKYPVGDRKAYEMALRKLGQDDEAKGKVAKLMNKINDHAFNLKMRTTKIGNAEMTEFYRDMVLPKFERKDFETMRMTQQMGLQAIHMHHQYGRAYGKWNTIMSLIKNILIWGAWGITKDERVPAAIVSMWPQETLDGFYFNFIKRHLPKQKLQLAADTKFMRSRKMRSARSKRIMRGFEQDNILPPDRAVMHTRWYPTTKETWGKRRQKELVARYQATKALPAGGDATPQTFLRR